MSCQTSFDSIESIRLAFLKLEHCCSDCDQTAVAYLRHVLLTQLADLEAASAIIETLALSEPAGAAGDLSFDEPETLEENNGRRA